MKDPRSLVEDCYSLQVNCFFIVESMLVVNIMMSHGLVPLSLSEIKSMREAYLQVCSFHGFLCGI